jgi:hypothetical protein
MVELGGGLEIKRNVMMVGRITLFRGIVVLICFGFQDV